jgi:hypothetical protein
MSYNPSMPDEKLANSNASAEAEHTVVDDDQSTNSVSAAEQTRQSTAATESSAHSRESASDRPSGRDNNPLKLHKRTEQGGREGPDPVRYGDWEKNGRCIDF